MDKLGTMPPAPFVYINGFPGVGKYTVSKALQYAIRRLALYILLIFVLRAGN
jgi:broad-specificity NMP kinase